MIGYILKRLFQVVPVLIVASVIVFLLIYLIPGDPVQVVLGPDARDEQIEAVRVEMGFDKPIYVQYFIWLGNVLRGNLGNSFINDFPVSKLLMTRLPATIALTAGGFVVAIILSFVVAVSSVMWRNTFVERICLNYAIFSYAVPVFLLGILFILFFSVFLRWFPPGGYVPLTQSPLRFLRFLIMPAVTIGIYVSSTLSRFLRFSLLDTLNQDYVRTARAKGVPENVIILKHVLKNALIPVVTVLGLQMGRFMGGAVITEAVFNWPGLGYMIWTAILNRDYSVVQGAILFIVVAFLVINTMTDIVYAFLNPKIRYD